MRRINDNDILSAFSFQLVVKLKARGKHTPTHGLASTSRMRTAISPGQWQPWTAVSPLLGLIMQHGISSRRFYEWTKPCFHGCYYLVDVVVGMQEVLARPWVPLFVSHAIASFQSHAIQNRSK